MNKKLISTIMATALLSTNLITASASSDTIEISAANKGKLINPTSDKNLGCSQILKRYKSR